MAAVHRNSLKPVAVADWSEAADLRKQRISKRIADHKHSADKVDVEATRKRRERLEALTRALQTPSRNRKEGYSHTPQPVNSAKVKLMPLRSRKPSNESVSKKNVASSRSSNKSKNAAPKVSEEEKYEAKLMEQWKKNREMETDTRSLRSITRLSNHDPEDYPNDQVYGDVDQQYGYGPDARKNDDDDDDEDDDEDDEGDDDYGEEEVEEKHPKMDKKKHTDKQDVVKKPETSSKKRDVLPEADEKAKENYENDDNEKVSLKIVKEIIQQMKGLTEEERLRGVYRARNQLSIENNPPTQMYIDEGAIPPLVTALSSFNPNLQFEAAWALTNISSGHSEQAMAVYEGGAVPELIHLLSSPYNRVSDQCVWAVGNLAGDGPFLWHAVVDKGAVKPLYALIERSPSLSSLRNLSWTFSNILRHKPLTLSKADFAICIKAVRLFLHHPDKEIHLNACWSLVYITDNEPDTIGDVIKAGILPRLIEDLLDNADTKTVTPAIRAIGNIMTASDELTDRVVTSGVVPVLVKHLYNPSSGIRKDAAWALSNVTAGTQAQIQEVLDAKALPPLAAIMNKDEPKIKKEAAWCVSNMTEAGTKEQLNEIVGSNLVQTLTRTISQNKDDEALLVVAFEGLKNMIEKCNDHDRVARQILSEISLPEIKAYGNHSNEYIQSSTSTIYKIASKSKSKT